MVETGLEGAVSLTGRALARQRDLFDRWPVIRVAKPKIRGEPGIRIVPFFYWQPRATRIVRWSVP